MKQKNKKNNYKLGSYVKYANGGRIDPSAAISMGGNMLGSIVGGDEGSVISSTASGAAAGTAIAPGIGTIIGGGLGLVGGILGANKRRKAERRAFNQKQQLFQDNYFDNIDATRDTINDNPYGIQEFETGGDIKPKLGRNRRAIKSAKNKAGNWIKNADGDTILENVFEFFDPSGISSWDDVYRSFSDPTPNSTVQEIAGAVPLVGNLGKGLKGAKAAYPWFIGALTGRAVDGISDLKNLGTSPVKKADGGLVDPGDIARGKVKSDDRAYWNGFVDFVNKKGYSGSPELDKRDTRLSRKLFDEYNKSNSGGYEYDTFIPAIQQEIANYRNNAINEVKAGRMGLTNDDGSLYKGKIADYDFDNNYMQGLSNVDGWAGSKTTSWKFPKAYLTENNSTKEINNPLYTKNKFADGGEVFPNVINIEKGELQINPETGKILREYNGINPETGGLYEPHSKGKDTKNNMVTAEEGTFIITKKEAKNYKNAMDNNDKLHQNTILQNIRNYKNKNDRKFANGSDVPPLLSRQNPYSGNGAIAMASDGQFPGLLAPAVGGRVNPSYAMNNTITPTNYGSGINSTNIPQSQGFNFNGITDFLSNYGPSLINIGRGLFDNPEVEANVNPNYNSYRNQVLNNMPQDVSFEPVRQQLLRQQRTAFNQIDNSTSGSPIARANKQNIVANTQNQMGRLAMEQQMQNNQVRAQRGNIYNNLGMQDVGAQDRAQQINLGIDDVNARNRGARENLLTTGLSQLQQTYLNNRTNNSKAAMDKYKVELLRQMFPNLKYYGNQFGDDVLSKLMGG